MIVLLSGGQDSTTVLWHSLAHHERVEALVVDYGQRHSREIGAARAIAKHAGVFLHEARVKLPDLSSSLTDGFDPGPRVDGLPRTFVPGRNAVFLALAAAVAYEANVNAIAVGCSAIDFSGYPDCRPAFLLAQGVALSQAIDRPLRIEAPLIDRSKAQTVRMALDLGVKCWAALALSWTCYLGGSAPCDECAACVLRAKGFDEAGQVDPAKAALFRPRAIGDT